MDNAVIRSGGKQYKVSKGSIIEVDKLPIAEGKEAVFDDVLLWASNNEVKIGTPKLSDVKVKAKIIKQIKGDKIRVAKFKAKSRYRRVMGFRPRITRLQITQIKNDLL